MNIYINKYIYIYKETLMWVFNLRVQEKLSCLEKTLGTMVTEKPFIWDLASHTEFGCILRIRGNHR